MTISDLIRQLELVVAQHGDIPIIIGGECEMPIRGVEVFRSSAGTVVAEIIAEYD